MDNWERKANRKLAKQGLRLANAGMGEQGWYVTIEVDGEVTKVWATDEPKRRAGDIDEALEVVVPGELANCDTCRGDGNEEYWDDEAQGYASRSCTACGGCGQAETPAEQQLELSGEEGAACPECGEMQCGCDLSQPMGDEPIVTDLDRDDDYDLTRDFGNRTSQHEGLDFDRFMDRALLAEGRAHGVDAKEMSPMRKRAAAHQERPLGRIRFARKP
jgi:hypothetical protein